VSGWEASARPEREHRILDSLQARFGREETVDLLRDPDFAEAFPAYHWQVGFDEPEGPGSLSVSLTPSGALWQVDADGYPERQAAHFLDDDALRFALDVEETDTTFSSLPDSQIAAFFQFTDTSLEDYQRDAYLWSLLEPLRTIDGDTSMSVRITLGRHSAEQMALHHAAGIEPLEDASLTVDSLSYDDGAMTVYLLGETEAGTPIEAHLEVESTGQLREVGVTHFPGESSTDVSFIAFNVVMGLMYALLGLSLFVYFFRRFFARLVDVRQALWDGALVALPMSAFVAIFTGVVEMQGGTTLQVVLALAFVLLFFFVFFFVLMTALAGSTEALAQEAWASKLRASVLLRKAAFLNQRVGYAFLRGTLAGVALAGVAVAMLWLLPFPMRLKQDLNVLLGEIPARGVMPFLVAGPTAYWVLTPTLLGIGSFMRLRGLPSWLILAVASAAIVLLGPITFYFNPVFLTWLGTLPVALVSAWLFLRYDFLTAFLAYFFTMVGWTSANAYMIGTTNPTIDAIIAALVTVGALALGFVGARSGTTGDDRVNYVPDYITEMAQQERLKQELEIAHEVQMSFLPRTMPDVEGVDMAAMCLAASEVGGDYYDFIPLGDGRLAVVIGDVSGKGIQAAFYMTLTKGFFRSLIRQVHSPAEVLRRLNALFRESAPRGTFISMIYGVLDVEARTFTFARAGHNPLILKRSPSQEARSVAPQFVQPRGMAIGFASGERFDAHIEEEQLSLRLGDTVVLYTDGFSEAMDRDKALYSDERLARRIADLGALAAHEILHGVTTDVQRFAGAAAQHDDMTMLVFKLTAPPRSSSAASSPTCAPSPPTTASATT
jgi:serine phosphatase RsbU (regulator of sigma subunit)